MQATFKQNFARRSTEKCKWFVEGPQKNCENNQDREKATFR